MEVYTDARRLDVSTAILDRDAVVLDDQGRSDFNRLTASLGGRGGKRASTETLLYAFDLLHLDGIDVSEMALSERRHLLEDLLEGRPLDEIRLSEEIEADGAALLQSACQHGLEGIIAKYRDKTVSAWPEGRLAQDQMCPERKLRRDRL